MEWESPDVPTTQWIALTFSMADSLLVLHLMMMLVEIII